MKRKLSYLILLIFLPITVMAKVQNNQPAPNFTAIDANGTQVSLNDFKGKTVVLEWSNFECPFVRKHYQAGHMQALQRFAKNNGVVWLTIMSSAPKKQGHYPGNELKQVLNKNRNVATHVLRDESGQIGKMYGAKTTPHMFVIDPNGTLVYQGAIDSIKSVRTSDIDKATNYVRVAINAIKQGKPIAVPVSQPYGCSIKY